MSWSAFVASNLTLWLGSWSRLVSKGTAGLAAGPNWLASNLGTRKCSFAWGEEPTGAVPAVTTVGLLAIESSDFGGIGRGGDGRNGPGQFLRVWRFVAPGHSGLFNPAVGFSQAPKFRKR